VSRTIDVLDTILDRSVVLGYSRLGYALRQRWWNPDDPAPGALADRSVVITGANSGLGRAAAARCADLGARVLMLVRDLDRGHRAAEHIRADLPLADLVVLRCDVSDPESIRECVDGLRGRTDRIDGLIHNAGVLPATRSESATGHELTLATHVLGPLLLTGLLREHLAGSGDARVVLMSSGGMLTAGVPDDPEYRRGHYRGARAYARTKRLQVAFTPSLARCLLKDGIAVYAMHPGWANTPGVASSLPAFHQAMAPILRTPEQAADTAAWLVATQPRPSTGTYWHDRRQRPMHLLPFVDDDPAKVRSAWEYCLESIEAEGRDRVR
jgi:NAD(P)-dependent dehydrogenase (short-subunit alcohol dehydrogenase family)